MTLHSYRSRWNVVPPDPGSEWLEETIKATKTLPLPALYVHGEDDGVNPPATAEKVHKTFTGSFEQVCLPGVGHFPRREAPDAFAARLLPFLTATGF